MFRFAQHDKDKRAGLAQKFCWRLWLFRCELCHGSARALRRPRFVRRVIAGCCATAASFDQSRTIAVEQHIKCPFVAEPLSTEKLGCGR